MPPAKVRIERIEGNRMRQNTFHKRKLGLIKKAIELTVLCDCDCSIILRSGPTVTCKEGRLMAYCNKDINEMIAECQPTLTTLNHFTNADYARFSKDKDAISLVSHSASVQRENAGHPAAARSPLPALALDDEDEVSGGEDTEKAQLKARIQALEEEMRAMRGREHAQPAMKTRSTRMQVKEEVGDAVCLSRSSSSHHSTGKRMLDPPPAVDNTPTPEALVNVTTPKIGMPPLKRSRMSPEADSSRDLPPVPRCGEGIFGERMHDRRVPQQEYSGVPSWMFGATSKELPSPRSAAIFSQPSPQNITSLLTAKHNPNSVFDPANLGVSAASVFEQDGKLCREDSWSLENMLGTSNLLGNSLANNRPPLSPSMVLSTPGAHGPAPIENPCSALRV